MIVCNYVGRNVSDTSDDSGGSSCLTFSSYSIFTLSILVDTWDGTMEVSTDGATWIEWKGARVGAKFSGKDYRIMVRGTGNTHVTGVNSSGMWSIDALTGVRCSGNIETLLDWETVANGGHPTMDEYCFRSMFKGCTSLTTAPELPVTTLAEGCYMTMFYGCTSLTEAPALPATTLADYCYNNMFNGCTSLIEAPALPATTLADYCYSTMFVGCTRIKLSQTSDAEYVNEYRIPTSGDGTTATNALTNMFAYTGGTFTGTPEINTVYYTANAIV